jgi:hypothetical protein
MKILKYFNYLLILSAGLNYIIRGDILSVIVIGLCLAYSVFKKDTITVKTDDRIKDEIEELKTNVSSLLIKNSYE